VPRRHGGNDFALASAAAGLMMVSGVAIPR
jgi:hypothetical protein